METMTYHCTRSFTPYNPHFFCPRHAYIRLHTHTIAHFAPLSRTHPQTCKHAHMHCHLPELKHLRIHWVNKGLQRSPENDSSAVLPQRHMNLVIIQSKHLPWWMYTGLQLTKLWKHYKHEPMQWHGKLARTHLNRCNFHVSGSTHRTHLPSLFALSDCLSPHTHANTHWLGRGCILFHPIILAQVTWLYLALDPKIAFKFDFLNSLGKSWCSHLSFSYQRPNLC